VRRGKRRSLDYFLGTMGEAVYMVIVRERKHLRHAIVKSSQAKYIFAAAKKEKFTGEVKGLAEKQGKGM